MLTAFNPFTAALRQSSYKLAQQDRSELSRATTELINCYQGNQLCYVRDYLARHIKNPELLRRYQSLAVFYNITRMLVDRVSTLGEVPVRVLWRHKNGSPHGPAQRKWDEITTRRMGAVPWDIFLPALARERELTKTVVAAVEWDLEREELILSSYTPNVIDVGYEDGNLRRDCPDYFTILKDEASGICQKWDFSGDTAFVVDVNALGVEESKPEKYPVIDQEKKRPLVPFVAFRTNIPKDSYFVWDGQSELLAAQEFVNRLYTALGVQMHYGAFKVPIVRGEWIGKDGQAPQITLDPSEFIQEPFDPLSSDTGPKIRWDGPAVEALIGAYLEMIGHWIEATAASFHLNPSAIRAKNEATSGYALQVESAALKVKHQMARTQSLAPLRELVHAMRTVWNYYQPNDQIPEDAEYDIVIPDYGSGVTVREEVDADLALMEKGIKTKRSLILKHNPGISNEEVERMLLEAEDDDPAEETKDDMTEEVPAVPDAESDEEVPSVTAQKPPAVPGEE